MKSSVGARLPLSLGRTSVPSGAPPPVQLRGPTILRPGYHRVAIVIGAVARGRVGGPRLASLLFYVAAGEHRVRP